MLCIYRYFAVSSSCLSLFSDQDERGGVSELSGLTQQSEDTGEDCGGGGSAEADDQQWRRPLTAGVAVSGTIAGADDDGQRVGAAERRTAAV